MSNHPVEFLEQIQDWMDQNHPDRMPFLRNPASDAAISRVEDRLGVIIPADLKSLYKAHDGQPEGAPTLYLNQRWLPIDLVAVAWEDLCVRHNSDHFKPREPISTALKNNSFAEWSSSWFPIFGSQTGDHYCVELNRGNSNPQGSIIWYLYDRPQRIIVSRNISELLERISKGLQDGRWILDISYDGLTD